MKNQETVRDLNPSHSPSPRGYCDNYTLNFVISHCNCSEAFTCHVNYSTVTYAMRSKSILPVWTIFQENGKKLCGNRVRSATFGMQFLLKSSPKRSRDPRRGPGLAVVIWRSVVTGRTRTRPRSFFRYRITFLLPVFSWCITNHFNYR